ncbi:MAG TPA: L-rhamnose mutarotase [Clostridia bacterium]
MDRIAWNMRLKPGMKGEYKKRHDEIWPEMTAVLDAAGIHNYTIWNVGEELFGYYEVEDRETGNRVQRESPVVDRWNTYMQDVIEVKIDPVTGTIPMLELMFFHK